MSGKWSSYHFPEKFCLLNGVLPSVPWKMVSLLSFITHDRQQHCLQISLHSPQLSSRACKARGGSKRLPSGVLFPKATVQSKPLLTGTLISTEFSGQKILLLLQWYRKLTRNYVHSSHQEVQQHGLYVDTLYAHPYGITTTHTTHQTIKRHASFLARILPVNLLPTRKWKK